MKERGILIGAAGFRGATLKIRPHLCFKGELADPFLSALDAILSRANIHA